MKTILVAEDDFPSRELLTEILTDWGYRVVQASNGLEALWAVKHQRPPLVLLDLSMPRLGGLETIRHIRKFDPSIRVVVVTGQLSEADATRLEALGVAAIIKPLPLSVLDELFA